MEATIDWFLFIWPSLTSALGLGMAIFASAHALLEKRDVRAAIGWVAFVWVVPFAGPVLYALLGINRVSRRAVRLMKSRLSDVPPAPPEAVVGAAGLPEGLLELRPLATLVERVTAAPLLGGNRIEPLDGGDEAYAAMIDAIGSAEETVGLASYIFDADEAGRSVADALAAAASRGVEVRVLIDGVGARYSRPSMIGLLRRRGVRAAAFLSLALPWRLPFANLRNHRKILVVDGKVGFTGGMNIRGGCLSSSPSSRAIRDLHFRIEGPIVSQLTSAFVEDWAVATRERLAPERWYDEPKPAGDALLRLVLDGPDHHLDKLRWTLLGALGEARHRVGVCTPYFLPDQSLQSALIVAAMRGVQVDIVIPERNNLFLIQWAQAADLDLLLERGVRIWLSPPPFDHTKLVLVDDHWSCVGSANWDSRSLRLNFELQIEGYDRALARELEERLDERIARATRFTLEAHRARPYPVKLRDGLARLLSPYL